MLEKSLAPPARVANPALPLDVMAERIEEEIARLKAARPILDARIDRAARIVVVQLSSPPASRPVRCRVRKGGRRVYLVSSLTSGGVTYEVNPADWSCSCPDAHRGSSVACKHSISSWLLARAALPREVGRHLDRVNAVNASAQREADHDDEEEGEQGCNACQGGWVFLDEDVIDPATGEASRATNPVRCRACEPAAPHHLSDEEMREWMDSARWRFARTMPKHPHFYSLRTWNDEELFGRVVRTIWDRGYDRIYLRRPWRSLDVGEHYVWIALAPPKPGDPAPVEETALINRARRVQDKLGEGA